MPGTRKLGKTTDQRKAMLRQQVTDLLDMGRMETTVFRAKEIAPLAEKMITLGKKKDMAAYRQALAFITREDVAKKVFEEVAPKYADRNGGYTRITRIGTRRGDAARDGCHRARVRFTRTQIVTHRLHLQPVRFRILQVSTDCGIIIFQTDNKEGRVCVFWSWRTNRTSIASLAKTLKAEGYSVDSCFDGVEALDYLEGAEYDAVVLDVMMPRMDGFSVLAQMRADGNETPVLFLTAKDSVPDRVHGLDSGADDYLVKPFSFDELLARLRVITRKHGGSATNVFTVADLTVDTASHHVARGGRTISLSAKEFALLEYMIRNRGVVLSRERIENHLWNYDYSGGSNVVDVYVSYLRRKIDADYPTKLIHTVWGVGWVLREEV